MWGKLHIFRVESLSTLSLVTLPALPIQIMQITCMYTQIPLRLTDFSTVEASKTGFSIVFGHQNERFMSGYVVQNYDCMITYVFAHEVLLVFYYTPGGNPDGADFAPGFGGVVFQSITYVSDNPCRSRSRKKAGLDYALFIHYKLTNFGEHIFFLLSHICTAFNCDYRVFPGLLQNEKPIWWSQTWSSSYLWKVEPIVFISSETSVCFRLDKCIISVV